MKLLFLTLVLIVEIISFSHWLPCHNFYDMYYFSGHDNSFQIDDAIHNDVGMPFWIIHLYHNKVTVSMFSILKNFILYWDFQFLINVLSFIGLFGILCAIFIIIDTKHNTRFIKLYLIILLFLPLIEIFKLIHIKFNIRLLVFFILLSGLSLWGFYKFLSKKRTGIIYFLLLFLIIISLFWNFYMPKEVFNYCI